MLRESAMFALDRPVRQFDATLQNAAGEAADSLRCGVGMYGRDRPRVSGVQEL